MTSKSIEVFSEETDNAVVRMPGRNYLGSVVQGDSLFLLHAQAMDILEELKHNPGNHAFYSTYTLAKSLEKRLEHYINVCEESGVELSFRIETSVEDYEDLMY